MIVTKYSRNFLFPYFLAKSNFVKFNQGFSQNFLNFVTFSKTFLNFVYL